LSTGKPATTKLTRRVTHAEDYCRRPGRRDQHLHGAGRAWRQQKKLFADGSAPHSFKLTRSRVSPNGLIVGHYERGGEVKVASAMLDSPSEREIARQERMKREG